MGRIGMLTFATCLCLLAVSHARELMSEYEGRPIYNHTLATIIVEYAAAAYSSSAALSDWRCSRCYGHTKGFKTVQVAVDTQQCLQAFVGVAVDPQAIIISFRGTLSVQNWMEDFDGMQVALNYPGMFGAMVHHGFYTDYTNIRPQILSAVEKAKTSYGDIKIIVTGHSLGGAMASLCGLDLVVNHNASNVQVMTFGQPRVGNAAFASSYSKLLPNTIRVTHNYDPVPHVPPYSSFLPMSYHHFPTEVWLHGGTEKVCDQSGEDPTCSDSVTGNSFLDHLSYYGVAMLPDTFPSCMPVNNRALDYSKRDSRGNAFLSRDPAASLKNLRAESQIQGKHNNTKE